MALPFRKAGGGFLNGVAGTIVGVALDSKTWPAKKGKDEYTTFSLELQIKQDGADEAVQQFLQGGFLHDEDTISDDGKNIETEKDVVDETSELGIFLASVVEAGFDEANLGNLRNFDGLVNQRFTFKRTEENPFKKAKPGKTKDGREVEFKDKYLQVSEYLGEAAPVKGSKSKPAAKAASKPAAKANGAAKNADADAQISQAEDVLLGVLASAGKAVDRAGLSAKIVRYSTENKFADDADEHNAIRESLRKLIGSEDFLNRQNGWTFDAKAKGQPVALA